MRRRQHHLSSGSHRGCGRVIDKIHQAGCRAGLSIKPGTAVEEIRPYLDKLEMLLVMTVEPGFGGQKYIPESTQRIKSVRRMITELGLSADIQVDGGITTETAQIVLDAGANVIVAGSAIFRGNIHDNVKLYRAILNGAE